MCLDSLNHSERISQLVQNKKSKSRRASDQRISFGPGREMGWIFLRGRWPFVRCRHDAVYSWIEEVERGEVMTWLLGLCLQLLTVDILIRTVDISPKSPKKTKTLMTNLHYSKRREKCSCFFYLGSVLFQNYLSQLRRKVVAKMVIIRVGLLDVNDRGHLTSVKLISIIFKCIFCGYQSEPWSGRKKSNKLFFFANIFCSPGPSSWSVWWSSLKRARYHRARRASSQTRKWRSLPCTNRTCYFGLSSISSSRCSSR